MYLLYKIQIKYPNPKTFTSEIFVSLQQTPLAE